jgi:hypothetical protein
LNKAFDDEVIPVNPVLQLRMKGAFKKNSATETINALEANEVNTLLDTVSLNYREHYPARTKMRLMGLTICTNPHPIRTQHSQKLKKPV